MYGVGVAAEASLERPQSIISLLPSPVSVHVPFARCGSAEIDSGAFGLQVQTRSRGRGRGRGEVKVRMKAISGSK